MSFYSFCLMPYSSPQLPLIPCTHTHAHTALRLLSSSLTVCMILWYQKSFDYCNYILFYDLIRQCVYFTVSSDVFVQLPQSLCIFSLWTSHVGCVICVVCSPPEWESISTMHVMLCMACMLADVKH
jgi:hypothetical protein